ncbi:MAG: NAD(FAD)-utilizing dehydrogenase [Firmicutes bacterium]|nr:NAD(FAD)-utilizing dehydrogenase [Bacillota bacterium]
MIRVHEIKIKAERSLKEIDFKSLAEKRLNLPRGSVTVCNVAKESVDAREKPAVYRVFSLDIETDLPDEFIIDAAKRQHYKYTAAKTEIYRPETEGAAFKKRPVIAGFGPCGMFAGLVLAMAGAKPIILERGSSMEERIAKVEAFWEGKGLDPDTNVQFGEGGAGTFSDGKLTSGIKNPAKSFVLKTFVDAGADPVIMYMQRPHIGTDVIRKAVVNIRKEIERLGGEVRFNTKWSSGLIDTDCTILALGHSARDTFRELYESGYLLEQKPFSIGIRIEHPQELIDLAQYGARHEELGIGPADYKINCRIGDRGVYSFCMCPGGVVIDSSSEDGACVCNGMSYSARDGKFANSALLCDVKTSDFGSDDALAGVEFQKKYEELAYRNGGGKLPRGQAAFDSLPSFAEDAIKKAIPVFAKKIAGFDRPSEIYGIESRSSSPVRIKRDASGVALASDGSLIAGIYPGGEGAGYAGGIMSAACDGIRLAELAIKNSRL